MPTRISIFLATCASDVLYGHEMLYIYIKYLLVRRVTLTTQLNWTYRLGVILRTAKTIVHFAASSIDTFTNTGDVYIKHLASASPEASNQIHQT